MNESDLDVALMGSDDDKAVATSVEAVERRVKDREPRLYNKGPVWQDRRDNKEWSAQMRALRKYKFDDLNNVPPLQIDEDGYPFKPPCASEHRRKRWTDTEQKVRFVLMWNYTAGNVTLACQEAGIKRVVYNKWRDEDPLFNEKLTEARLEIGDRAAYRLSQRIGLVRQTKGIDLHDSALFVYVKRYCPELMEGMMELNDAAVAKHQSNIPRPTR